MTFTYMNRSMIKKNRQDEQRRRKMQYMIQKGLSSNEIDNQSREADVINPMIPDEINTPDETTTCTDPLQTMDTAILNVEPMSAIQESKRQSGLQYILLDSMRTYYDALKMYLNQPFEKKCTTIFFCVGKPGVGKSASIVHFADIYDYTIHDVDAALYSHSDTIFSSFTKKLEDGKKRLNVLDVAEVLPLNILKEIIERYSNAIMSMQPLIIVLDTIDYKFQDWVLKSGHSVGCIKPVPFGELQIICRMNNVDPSTNCHHADGCVRQALMDGKWNSKDYKETDMRVLINRFKQSSDPEKKHILKEQMPIPLMNVLFGIYLNTQQTIHQVADRADLFSQLDVVGMHADEILVQKKWDGIDSIKGYAKSYSLPKKRRRDAMYDMNLNFK